MNKNEKLQLISEVIYRYEKLNNFTDKLAEIIGYENKISDNMYELFDDYINLAETLLQDHFNMLSWYIFDNDCGKKKYTCKLKEKRVKVTNTKKLLNIIEELIEN